MRTSAGPPVVLVFLVGGACACGFSRLADVHGITAVCCESLGDDDCSTGFPATCASACADVLAPFWEECGDFVSGLSAATFTFDIPSFGVFAGVCTSARALTHFANGVCSRNEEELQARVLDIQSSCCTQGGVNVCPDGVPWTCDAQCAVPFMTFFTACIDSGVMGVDDLASCKSKCLRQQPPACQLLELVLLPSSRVLVSARTNSSS
jgi:hypothetical protein